MSRSTHFARNAVSSLQIVVPNFGTTPDGNEVGQSDLLATFPSATIKASVEWPAGTCTQIKFSGSATGNITTGNPLLLSDSLNIGIPNGAEFWIRQYWVGSAGAVYANNGQVDLSLGDAMHIGASGISDQTASCDSVTNSGLGYMTPAAIVSNITLPALCLLGDSIQYGSNGGVTALGDQGITAPSAGPYFGYINMGKAGDSAVSFVNNNTVRQMLYQYCSHDINNYGHNDIAGSQTAAQLETNTETIWAEFTANSLGGGVNIQETLTPFTTSTDGWATTSNQTVTAFQSQLAAFNTAILTMALGAVNYFDDASVVGNGTNNSIWNAGVGYPACSPWTSDGIHPYTCADGVIVTSGIINLAQIHR